MANTGHTLTIGSDTMTFDSAEEASAEGYRLAKLNPDCNIRRYYNDRLVSAYNRWFGWS